MIKVNKKEYRNLEEQVLFNSDRIESILDTNVLLAQFGIKVIDQVNNESELLTKYPRTLFQGEYGDAVLVGVTKPYDYYIWTRPFDEEVYGDWLNIGQFPLPGPKGDTGATGQAGARGQRGNKWYTGTGIPSTSISDMIEGDLYLDAATGRVYRYLSVNAGWNFVMGIKGNRGEAGADGAPGPAGPVVDLVGVLTSVDQLPSNITEFVTSYGRQAAYLIGSDDPNTAKRVWGLTGTDDNLQWTDLGLFAAGTIIYVNGTPVETLEMNNYVPKAIDTSTKYSLSAYNKDTSTYEALPISYDYIKGTIPIRKELGRIEVGPPQNNEDATNVLYVNNKISEMASQIGSGAPERYVRNIPLSWREYVEGQGDVTVNETPKYLELKPGMEFDLITYADSTESDSICPYIDLIGNSAPGAAFSPYGAEYDGQEDANPTGTHKGVLRYHVLVAKDPQTINGEIINYLAPEITLYYRDGTFKQAYPKFQEVSGSDAPSFRQANLRLKLYGVPTYNSNIYYYGNTSPNTSLSEIK